MTMKTPTCDSVRCGGAADRRVNRDALGADKAILTGVGCSENTGDVAGGDRVDEGGRVVGTSEVGAAATRHSAADDVAAEAGRTRRRLTEYAAKWLTSRRLEEPLSEKCRAREKSGLLRCRSLDFRCNSRTSQLSDSDSSSTIPSASTKCTHNLKSFLPSLKLTIVLKYTVRTARYRRIAQHRRAQAR